MNYKELIFSAISDRLKENDIDTIYFSFNVITSKSLLYSVDKDNKEIPLSLSTSETTTVRLLLINKVVKQMKKEYADKVVKSIIVELCESTKEFNMYIEFENEVELLKLTK